MTVAAPPRTSGRAGTRPRARWKKYSVLPGFGITLGTTLVYLTLLVLIPLSGLFARSLAASWSEVWSKITDPRVLAAYRLSFGASVAGAAINAVFGFVVAWTLVRYRFPGRRLVDAMVDLPFALPTAVSGIALATIMGPNGWVGRLVEPLGVKIAFTRLGVVVALTLVGLPFVVRTLQPALE
jgi:sulfate/thiosulfate transport system permease protein